MLPLADPPETSRELDICIDKAMLDMLLFYGPPSCTGGGRMVWGAAGWCWRAAQAKQAGWVRGMRGWAGFRANFQMRMLMLLMLVHNLIITGPA